MLLYHLLPKELSGTKLVSLNELKKTNPALYKQHASKYIGREAIMFRHIPLLNCLWNDVIFLSPVHPAKIVAARLAYGVGLDRTKMRDWLVLPSERLDESQLLLFRHRPERLIQQEPEKEEYVRFAELSESEKAYLNEVPECALSLIRREKEKAFFQGFIPHLLYRGTIDIGDGHTIQC